MNDDGTPLSIVADSSLDIKKVTATPNTITAVRNTADKNDWKNPAAEPTKNIEIIAIIVGKRPLHGTKLFVITAISLSLDQ